MKKALAPIQLPTRPARQSALAARAVLFRAEQNCKAAGPHRKSHKAERRQEKSRLLALNDL
jgi:hypothetical protein